MANVGMMEGAYFVGRGELLRWLNSFLDLNYAKIEQVCSGAAFCQILDALHPRVVPLHRVKFDAKHEYEYIANWKVVQGAFDKLGIDKHIYIQQLVKGKFQDNLEFSQWMKKYFDTHWNGEDYPAAERRRLAGQKKRTAKPRGPIAPRTTTTQRLREANTAATRGSPKVESRSNVSPVKSTGKSVEKPTKPVAATTPATTQAARKGTKSESSTSPATSELLSEIALLKLQVQGLEKERDFYFNRLQEVEMLCQDCENDSSNGFVRKIKSILYVNDCDTDSTTSATSP